MSSLNATYQSLFERRSSPPGTGTGVAGPPGPPSPLPAPPGPATGGATLAAPDAEPPPAEKLRHGGPPGAGGRPPDQVPPVWPRADQWAVPAAGPMTPEEAELAAQYQAALTRTSQPGTSFQVAAPFAAGVPWTWPWSSNRPAYSAASPSGWPGAAAPPAYQPAPVIYATPPGDQTLSTRNFRIHLEGTGFSWGIERT